MVQRRDRARAGGQGLGVALRAADCIEDGLTGDLVGSYWSARRRCKELHEVGEVIDVVAIVVESLKRVARERMTIRGGAVSLRAALGHERRVGHAHLVEIRVAAEHVERGYLRLPAEPADRWLAVVRIDEVARLTRGGGIEDALEGRQRDEGVVRDRVHQPEPEERSGATAGDGLGLGR